MKPHSRLAICLLGILPILLTTSCRTGPAGRSEWTSLFNGKDLSGWSIRCQPQDQGKVFWTVADGSILCDSMGRKDQNYGWLRWSPNSPELYSAETVTVAAGKTRDTTATRLGIRRSELDAENGPLGAVAIDRADERRVELMKPRPTV